MEKIPYGITDYQLLQEQDYYYVDKTMYLEKLENVGRTLVYLRPKRFGKTLFCSMMYYYYDINSLSLFDSLFKSTYVYNNPTPNKNNYYVLKLDFSGMNMNIQDANDVELEFVARIIDGIKIFNEHYNLNAPFNNVKANLLLSDFLSYFNSLKLDRKLYIIIDEYDNFSNMILSKNVDVFKSILGDTGFVKSFYSIIKANSGTIIDRVFITGVCSISLDAMTSGFNISTDITNLEKFNSMTALTHDEVKELVNKIDEKNSEEIFKVMVENYDGYKFNEDGECVFNPTLTMYYLSNYIAEGHAPKELLDKNIISSYDQIKNVINLSKDKKKIIEELFENDEVTSELVTNFNMLNFLSRNDIISLLYYFGYLTIKSLGANGYTYKIPNKVIKEIFSKYFKNILIENDIVYDDTTIIQALNAMNGGYIDKITDYVSKIIEQSSNRDLINFNEKMIKQIYLTLLINNNAFNVFSEYEVNNGYIDLMLFKKNMANYNIMIELKYIKKSEYSEELLRLKKDAAKEQINKYILDDRIPKDNLKKYIVIFIGSEYILEEII